MIVDGKAIAEDIRYKLKSQIEALSESERPTLFIVRVGEGSATKQFVGIKKRFARAISIPVEEIVFEKKDVTTLSLKNTIHGLAGRNTLSGIIVQLPLPTHVDTEAVLNAVPSSHDIDVLSSESLRLFRDGRFPILPPVVGAVKEILSRNNVSLVNARVVVLGKGRLVGGPAITWFEKEGANVTMLDSKIPDISKYTRNADIILSGIGKPGILTSSMVKEAVVLLDAGTSEEGGKVVGDASLEVAAKCSLFTPVPGGIGPITVAILFQNLLILTAKSSI